MQHQSRMLHHENLFFSSEESHTLLLRLQGVNRTVNTLTTDAATVFTSARWKIRVTKKTARYEFPLSALSSFIVTCRSFLQKLHEFSLQWTRWPEAKE